MPAASAPPQPARPWLLQAADALASVFFPAACRLCDRVLLHASPVPICEDCLQSFALLRGNLCAVCGIPSSVWSLDVPSEQTASSRPSAEPLRCPECQTRTWNFERARSFAEYKSLLIRAIVILKFERMEPLGGWFAARLSEVAKNDQLTADLVVPVPLHRQRLRERGYNQAALIAKPLARRLGLPYKPVLLVRTRPRPDKQILTLQERWESVRGAFATHPGSRVDNLRILLVDDVMTTGATLDACAYALREAGAKSVIGLTIARAVRHPLVGSSTSNQRVAR